MNKLIIISLITSFLVSIPAYAKIERSEKAKNSFKYSHPCPANGNNHGSCAGYVIDHIKPLACGGADAVINMQWQTIEEGKAKDKWERKDCETKPQPTNGKYFTGKRGGYYTLSASGKKNYVDHSFCGR